MGSKAPARDISSQLRELFPQARMVCECARELDVCPADCTNMRAAREAIREWK
jgi:hypothetical protein